MTNVQTDEPTGQYSLRLWPGVVAVILQWVIRFGVPIVEPEAIPFAVISGLVCGLAIVVWWAFFSRASRSDRLGAVVLMVVALVVTSQIVHESIATAMMGMMFIIYAIPVLSLPFVVWAVATRNLPDRPRRVAMVATMLLACGGWTLVRTGGFTGELDQDFAWRWTDTPEERLLAKGGDELTALPAASAVAATGTSWSGFRGPDHDSIVPGIRVATDWSASPPVELWRRALGPGWSSFAVRGDLFYTQEQRGDQEVVACYNLTTGEPVWRHRDAARFWEANAGAGPRGTPTLSDGRVYTLGGTGLRRITVAQGAGGWTVDERWTSMGLKPYFNDFVVHKGHVFGFDRSIMACVDVEDGKRKWKGGRYGFGQLILLPDQDVLLVLSERGELALVAATPDRFMELARYPAIEGKTWNHPVIVGDILLVRNGEEMVAFRLTLAGKYATL